MSTGLFRRRDRGWGTIGTVAAFAAVAATAGGGFLIQRVASDDAAGLELPANRFAAPVFDCPEEPTVAAVHNGDRVFAIARHDSSPDWLLIRNPTDPSQQWWIEGRHVTMDAATDDLPEAGCADADPDDDSDQDAELAAPLNDDDAADDDADEDEDAAADDGGDDGDDRDADDRSDDPADNRSTTTTRAGSAPPTTRPGPTTTRAGSAPTTTRAPTTTSAPTSAPPPTTAPPTTTTQPPPVVGNPSASPSEIWERWGDGYSCGKPTTSHISVSATNATTVTMKWSGAASGSKAMSWNGSTWAASLGPFNENTINPQPDSKPITVTVEAIGPGGTNSRSTTVTLHDCHFG